MGGKVLVYGVGVIGSVYAARFSEAGFAVSVLARGERLASLRSTGLRVRQVFLEEEKTVAVAILEHLEAGAAWDLILVAVRAGQIVPALRTLAEAGQSGPILVVGNNLGPWDEESAIVGEARLVLGFGAFGGYRDGESVVYLDGRTKRKPGPENISRTTVGILSEAARPAMEVVRGMLAAARLPSSESPDIQAWLVCHAALVFPLAGAIYAAGGEQGRTCRTRDAIVLGIRACRELFGALKALGVTVEPESLRKMLSMPEPLLVHTLRKGFAKESARVAMFGHANAAGGHGEIAGTASVLDSIVRRAGLPLPSWDTLLPHFPGDGQVPPLRDGARTIRLRPW